jgi:23S rRNA (adenine2030-N6)-methyltransferase
MNYRHIYHAGCFADVVKHIVLITLLQRLHEKEKPFRVIDTHGGIGVYDLSRQEAQKTKEHEGGIQQLLSQPGDLLFQSYVDLINKLNPNNNLIYYPGSPWIIRQFLRRQDILQVCELHPQDYQVLEKLFSKDKQVQVFNRDGYNSLKAFLPPIERRGLVFIDPPFEDKSEFSQILRGIKEAYQRFATGIYCIWFPIKEMHAIRQFYEGLQVLKIPKILVLEYIINTKFPSDQLNGCGLILINPPWQSDARLEKVLSLLLPALGHEKTGKTRLTWLTSEIAAMHKWKR